MSLIYRIAEARSAHEKLRQPSSGRRSQHELFAASREVTDSLEELRAAAKRHPQAARLWGTIARLTADAELQVVARGGTDVFPDASAVWQEYEFLEQAFAEPTEI
jgi:hypothetical protein